MSVEHTFDKRDLRLFFCFAWPVDSIKLFCTTEQYVMSSKSLPIAKKQQQQRQRLIRAISIKLYALVMRCPSSKLKYKPGRIFCNAILVDHLFFFCRFPRSQITSTPSSSKANKLNRVCKYTRALVQIWNTLTSTHTHTHIHIVSFTGVCTIEPMYMERRKKLVVHLYLCCFDKH